MLLIALIGCSNQEKRINVDSDNQDDHQKYVEKKHDDLLQAENAEEQHDEQTIRLLPVPSEATFERVYGWLGNDILVYSFVKNGTYYVLTHDLYNDMTNQIFSSDAPIVNILIHENSQHLFIHTSPQANMAYIYFLNEEGEIYYSTEIESYELSYEWNQYDPNVMLITAFGEDWSYEVFQLVLATGELKKIEPIQPFVKWLNEEEILEQDWTDDMALFAPIVRKSLQPIDDEKIYQSAYRFDVLSHNQVLIINVPDSLDDRFVYRLLDLQTKKEKPLLIIPTLMQYTDWLIPFYDYIEQQHRLITFAPYTHGYADVYDQGFQLLSIQINDQTETIHLDQMENKPIDCNQSGDHCLYGHQFEDMIHLKTGEIISLLTKGHPF